VVIEDFDGSCPDRDERLRFAKDETIRVIKAPFSQDKPWYGECVTRSPGEKCERFSGEFPCDMVDVKWMAS
jgi:hypothetical protein